MTLDETDWWGIAAAACQDLIDSVARLNLSKAEVTYARSIRGGESRRVISGPEEVVRAFLVHRLVHVLGYRPERIEIEREYTAGRGRRTNKPRIDVVLENPDGGAFFFIEAKDPAKFEADKPLIKGQLFSLARLHEEDTGKKILYLVYYTVECRDSDLIDKAIIIDREKYPTYDEWVAAGEPSIGDTLASHYHKPQRTPLTKGGSRDLVHNFSLADIEAVATNLHNVLWGGGATGDTEVFTSLVNLILAKIQDEYDAVEGAQYQFQVLSHGDELESPAALFVRVNELYRTALRQQLSKEGNLDDQWIVNKEKLPSARSCTR